MTTDPNSREIELVQHDNISSSKETYKLLLLTLILSLLSSVLALVVAIKSHREDDATTKNGEKDHKNITRELQELRDEIALLKKNPSTSPGPC
ncbi:MAG TPA: hypothetical protein PKA10_12355 [Selenomonadales bacterium]|nr:hypothetical protein [Selenomonadales bacterium]